MTRTEAVRVAIRDELEVWSASLDAVPGLRSVTVVVLLKPDGMVRTVLVRPESERDRERSNGGVVRP
mgnify:CR=1 FL=1